jgi:hypothetical protein
MKILKSILIGLGLFCASGVTPSYAYVECTTKVSRVWNDATLVGIWVIFENGNAGVSSNQATIPDTLSIAMTALTTDLKLRRAMLMALPVPAQLQPSCSAAGW